MIHEKIDWEKLTYDELIGIIHKVQKELGYRGTLTICKNIKYKGRIKLSNIEYITGYTIEK